MRKTDWRPLRGYKSIKMSRKSREFCNQVFKMYFLAVLITDHGPSTLKDIGGVCGVCQYHYGKLTCVLILKNTVVSIFTIKNQRNLKYTTGMIHRHCTCSNTIIHLMQLVLTCLMVFISNFFVKTVNTLTYWTNG